MFSVFFYLRFQSWVLSAKSNQHKIFYEMEMPGLLLDHKDDSSGQQLTSLFSPFQEWTESRLYAGWEQPSLSATNIFPVPSFHSQSLDGSTHSPTTREKGIRSLGKIIDRSRQQLPPEQWSWPTAQAPWAVRSECCELFWQWPPLPRYSVSRISPLAATSLSVQHSRVVVGSRNRAVLWHWEVMLGSLLLPVSWAVWGCAGQAPANKMPWFHLW